MWTPGHHTGQGWFRVPGGAQVSLLRVISRERRRASIAVFKRLKAIRVGPGRTEAGGVEIAAVILTRDHQDVCECAPLVTRRASANPGRPADSPPRRGMAGAYDLAGPSRRGHPLFHIHVRPQLRTG